MAMKLNRRGRKTPSRSVARVCATATRKHKVEPRRSCRSIRSTHLRSCAPGWQTSRAGLIGALHLINFPAAGFFREMDAQFFLHSLGAIQKHMGVALVAVNLDCGNGN